MLSARNTEVNTLNRDPMWGPVLFTRAQDPYLLAQNCVCTDHGHLLVLNTEAGASTVGLDTWKSPAGKVKEPVKEAIGAGNHHVDCACVLSEEE